MGRFDKGKEARQVGGANEKPLISVILPIYKVEKYLCQCVDSLIDQDYPNYEIILVDDGSPDNCGKICDEYAAEHTAIQVIHQKTKGLPPQEMRECEQQKGIILHSWTRTTGWTPITSRF